MSAPPPYYGQQVGICVELIVGWTVTFQQGAYPAYPQYGQNVQYVYPQGTVYTAQPTTVMSADSLHWTA